MNLSEGGRKEGWREGRRGEGGKEGEREISSKLEVDIANELVGDSEHRLRMFGKF